MRRLFLTLVGISIAVYANLGVAADSLPPTNCGLSSPLGDNYEHTAQSVVPNFGASTVMQTYLPI